MNKTRLIRKIINLERKNNLKIELLKKPYQQIEKKYNILLVKNKFNEINIEKINSKIQKNDEFKKIEKNILTRYYTGLILIFSSCCIYNLITK